MKSSFEFLSKLPRDFYNRDLIEVAKSLLGKALVKVSDQTLAGVIVEVEAYDGLTDKAAHSFGGVTERNKIMFEEGGLLYVYFIYGVHYCCNVVTGEKNVGNAVLIRGVEPVVGINEMFHNRFGERNPSDKEKLSVTNGPAKLTKAMGINKSLNGADLTGNKIYIAETSYPKKFNIVSTTRIGITKSVDLPWRFYIKNNPYVSKK